MALATKPNAPRKSKRIPHWRQTPNPEVDVFDCVNADSFTNPSKFKPAKKAFEQPKHLTPGYLAHIASAKWKDFREAVLRARGRKCERCGNSSRRIEVHHRSYKNLGDEKPEDVEVLCFVCHRGEHKARKKLNR